jgi:hypothetical protein
MAKPRAPRAPRTSVRLVRQREAARAALAHDEILRHDARYLTNQRQQQFLDGVEYVRRGVRAGETAEQAFDLAASPIDRRPPAFMDGANAGRALHYAADQSQDFARRAHAAYGVPFSGPDKKAIARNLECEIALAVRNESSSGRSPRR